MGRFGLVWFTKGGEDFTTKTFLVDLILHLRSFALGTTAWTRHMGVIEYWRTLATYTDGIWSSHVGILMKVTTCGYSVKKTVGRTFFAVEVITKLGHIVVRTSGKGMVYILYIDIILWLYTPFWN